MAEKEYIERKDLINNRPPQRDPYQTGKEEYNKGYNDGIKAVLSCIKIQLSAYAAEVVRCKDCEYNNECSVQDFGEMHQNDFCSHGKRKELDNDT